jgi:hypothetical protein
MFEAFFTATGLIGLGTFIFVVGVLGVSRALDLISGTNDDGEDYAD